MTIGTLDINKLTLADIARISALMKQLSENYPRIFKRNLARVLERGVILIVRSGDEGGKIVGIATLAIYPILYGELARIEDVVVDEKHRGKGLGERLVVGLIDKARELNVDKLYLTSSPKRVAANALYQKLGFELYDTNVYKMIL